MVARAALQPDDSSPLWDEKTPVDEPISPGELYKNFDRARDAYDSAKHDFTSRTIYGNVSLDIPDENNKKARLIDAIDRLVFTTESLSAQMQLDLEDTHDTNLQAGFYSDIQGLSQSVINLLEERERLINMVNQTGEELAASVRRAVSSVSALPSE